MICINEDYQVEMVDIESISPSPENDDIYGKIVHDEQMSALIKSIELRGLEEPIIVTADDYIVSGHRRYYACCSLEMQEIPIRRKSYDRSGNEEFHRILTEYNPQRVKTPGSLLKEALLRCQNKEDVSRVRGVVVECSGGIYTC